MKLHMILIIGFALGVTGCGKNDEAATEPADDAQTAMPAAESMATEDAVSELERYEYEGFLKHMHVHADQLDLINNALADDDLEATVTPASWLSRHDTASGIPADLLPYLYEMRDAARVLEDAADLETARAASARITEQCQGCHAAAGIVLEGGQQIGE